MRKTDKTLFIIMIIAGMALIANATTYYVATNGNDSNPGTEALPWRTIQKAALTMQAGDMVYVKSGTYKERVSPAHSGNALAYITYSAYPGDTVIIDGSNIVLPSWSGLFDIQEVNYIRIAGFRIMNAGPGMNNAGILVDNASHIIIEDNYIYNTVSSGIGIWNSNYVSVYGNEISLCCNDGQEECISVGGSANFEIANNHVHHGGPGTNGGEGIDIKDGSHDGKVYKNNVHHMNRVAMYLDAWDKHTYNVEVFQNIVHDNNYADGFAVASEMGGLLENISIYNNISYNNGYRGFVFGDWGGQVPTHPLNNIKLINNTFYGNGTSGWGGGIAIDNKWTTNILIRNNLISANKSFTIVVGSDVPMPTIDYNLIDGFMNEPNETKGTNYQEGNPLLVNPAGGNFHLKINSPAIDNGSSVDAPEYDFDGVPRQGLGYEIGAFEYIIIAPRIYAEPNPINFGNILVNNAKEYTLTIKNVGTANLIISSITSPTLPFSLIADNCSSETIPPGAACSIIIQCQPSATGTFSSSLYITSNDEINSTYQVNLNVVSVPYIMTPENLILYNDATGIWEPGETVILAPTWKNNSNNNLNSVLGTAVSNDKTIVLEGTAAYGNIPAGTTASCINTGNCYGATAIGPRPKTHWDISITETLSTTHINDWLIHIGASFKDVSLSNIFYYYIEMLLHKGITEGCDINHYCPFDYVLRSQMAKFICTAMNGVANDSCQLSSCEGIFQDVSSSNPFCPYIETLYKDGIISGCQTSPLLFCPSANTNRQAMAKFICTAMNEVNPGTCVISTCNSIFADVPSSNPFCPYIEALYNANIISGCQSSPLLYCPNNNITRAQMSKYLINAF